MNNYIFKLRSILFDNQHVRIRVKFEKQFLINENPFLDSNSFDIENSPEELIFDLDNNNDIKNIKTDVRLRSYCVENGDWFSLSGVKTINIYRGVVIDDISK